MLVFTNKITRLTRKQFGCVMDLNVFGVSQNKCFGRDGDIDVAQCTYLSRLATALMYCQLLKKSNDHKDKGTMEEFFEQLYKFNPNPSDDYYHVLDVHKTQFQEIYQQLLNKFYFRKCVSSNCLFTENKGSKSDEAAIYAKRINKIVYGFVHTKNEGILIPTAIIDVVYLYFFTKESAEEIMGDVHKLFFHQK